MFIVPLLKVLYKLPEVLQDIVCFVFFLGILQLSLAISFGKGT